MSPKVVFSLGMAGCVVVGVFVAAAAHEWLGFGPVGTICAGLFGFFVAAAAGAVYVISNTRLTG